MGKGMIKDPFRHLITYIQIEPEIETPVREILLSVIERVAHYGVQYRLHDKTQDGLRKALFMEHLAEDLRDVATKYRLLEDPCTANDQNDNPHS